jgi:hypothetical protein
MVGVTSPMLREHRTDSVRFLLGLAAGGLAAGLVVALVAYLIGSAVHVLVPAQGRLLLLAGTCATLGTADLLNRTPHVWRQVPQALVRVLPPGLLGTVWGFDIGLLFTTQKVVSLVWVAFAAVVLVQPSSAPGVLVAMAALSCLTIAILSLTVGAGTSTHGSKRDRTWLRRIRATSGAVLLVLCVATLAQAFQA